MDARRQVVVADEDVLEVRVAGGPVDRPVHAQVPPHELRAVGADDVQGLDLGRELVELGPDRARRALGGAAGGPRLELHPDLRDVRQVGDVHAGRERPAPRVGHDEPVALEAFQRLAHRGASHPERPGQLVVVDRLTGLDVQHDQLVPDREVGPVGQRNRERVQLERCGGHPSIVKPGGPEILSGRCDQHTLPVQLIYQSPLAAARTGER